MKLTYEQIKRIQETTKHPLQSIKDVFEEVCIALGEDYYFKKSLGNNSYVIHHYENAVIVGTIFMETYRFSDTKQIKRLYGSNYLDKVYEFDEEGNLK